MRGMNRVVLVGYIGTEPELLKSKSGKTYTRLSLATHRGWKNENGEYVQATDWHRIQVFGRPAEACCSRLRKGAPVAVEGHLVTYKSKDRNEVEMTRTSVVAEEVFFLSGSKAATDKGQEVSGP